MTEAICSRRDFSRIFGQSLAAALAAPCLPQLIGCRAAQTDSRGRHSPEFQRKSLRPLAQSPRRSRRLRPSREPLPRRRLSRSDCRARAKIQREVRKYHSRLRLHGNSARADDAFLDPSRNVVAADPTFEAVLDYARVLHANAVKIPLTPDHRHDLPKMAAACTSKTGVVYVCNPNNPTGTIVTREEIAAFVQAVPPTTLIVVDEAYFDFADDPRYASAIEFIPAHPNVIVARTFSKIYGMAGMRLGYAVGAKEPIARLAAQLLQDNGNAAVLQAALASLADDEHVATCRAQLNDTRQWLCAELTKDSRPFIPSQANFVMLDMGTDVKPIIEQFRARNILVGRRFAAMPNFLRVTIGTQPETESFVAALREIAPVRSARAAA